VWRFLIGGLQLLLRPPIDFDPSPWFRRWLIPGVLGKEDVEFIGLLDGRPIYIHILHAAVQVGDTVGPDTSVVPGALADPVNSDGTLLHIDVLDVLVPGERNNRRYRYRLGVEPLIPFAGRVSGFLLGQVLFAAGLPFLDVGLTDCQSRLYPRKCFPEEEDDDTCRNELSHDGFPLVVKI